MVFGECHIGSSTVEQYALILHKFGIQHSSNVNCWDSAKVDLNCCQSLCLESHGYNWNHSWSPSVSANADCCGC